MTATFTTPRTWVAAELVTASLLNTHLRDMMDFLVEHPDAFSVRTTSGTFTTTSATYVAVDATYSVTVETHGGVLLLGAAFNVDCTSSGVITFAFDIDGTQHSEHAPSYNPTPGTPDTAGRGNSQWYFLVTGLAAGSHTVALKWKATAGTATMYNTMRESHFWGSEL